MNYALEKTKVFPYVAWGAIVLFALLTLQLTLHVKKEIIQIAESQTKPLE